MSRHYDPQIATTRVQEHLNLTQKWLQDWRIKVNDTKSTQVIYTIRPSYSPHVYLNNIEIPRANVAKYLGLHLDSKMTWKVHITKQKEGDGYKNLKNVLVSWEIIIPFLRKQATPLQGHHKTNPDLRHRVMGLL
jgi:hypothetical protein